MDAISMRYDSSLILDYGNASASGVNIGVPAFASTSDLRATLVHEYAHYIEDYASGTVIGSRNPSVLFVPGPPDFRDTVTGYANEIHNRGILHISGASLTKANPLYPGTRIPTIYGAFFRGNIFRSLPRRFGGSVDILTYSEITSLLR